jgi:hypothetical protein
MADLITYIKDLEAFRVEALAIANDENHPANSMVKLVEDGLIFNGGLHVPVVYNGNMSVALCRTDTPDTIDGTIENLEVIGECIKNESGENEYSFRQGGEGKCYSVYSIDPITLEDGIVYTPPKMFGVFA